MKKQNKINFFGFSITNWYRQSRNLNNEQKGILISAIIAFMDNDSYTITDTTVLQRYNDCMQDFVYMKERALNISNRNSENQRKRWEKQYDRNTTVIRPYKSGTPNENENENINEKEKERNILSDSQANADEIQPDASCNKGNGAAYKQDALEVLRFLCECTGRQYRPVPANLNPIVVKLKSGITVPDCKDVIAFKAETWGRDEKMAQYIRPKTIFAASNFENYLAEALAGFGDSKREWRL